MEVLSLFPKPPKAFGSLPDTQWSRLTMLKNEVVQTMSLNIKFSYLAENSKFSWSNSYFSILTPTFLRDGFLNSCFQNPSENSAFNYPKICVPSKSDLYPQMLNPRGTCTPKSKCEWECWLYGIFFVCRIRAKNLSRWKKYLQINNFNFTKICCPVLCERECLQFMFISVSKFNNKGVFRLHVHWAGLVL